MVRQMGTWMDHIDERILEYIAERGAASAWMVATDFGMNEKYVRQRCLVLANADLLARDCREGLSPEWNLTTDGALYLAGELDAELRRPLPSRRPPDKIRPGWWAGFG
jgi:hypothetical protein